MIVELNIDISNKRQQHIEREEIKKLERKYLVDEAKGLSIENAAAAAAAKSTFFKIFEDANRNEEKKERAKLKHI